MKITLMIDVEEVAGLPPVIRDWVNYQLRALGLFPAGEAPVQQATVQPAPVQQAPAPAPIGQPVVSPKAPVVEGNTRVFLADRNHFSQQNAAVDVLTGRPVDIAVPTAPSVPQMQNTPVSVTPVQTAGPVTPVSHPACDVPTARAAAIRLHNNTALGGKAAVDNAITRSGIGTMANLNESNAGALYSAILSMGGT